MNNVINLRDKDIKMNLKDSIARINWARKIHNDIYEVGVFFESGRMEGGSQNWFVKAEVGKGFIPIECSMYKTPETVVLNLAGLEIE